LWFLMVMMKSRDDVEMAFERNIYASFVEATTFLQSSLFKTRTRHGQDEELKMCIQHSCSSAQDLHCPD